MAFCSSCGQKIDKEARFCPSCGASVEVENNEQRKQIFEGSVHKCPNCGEVINSFSAKCPSCGHEFRDVQASSSVKEFARQLQDIESRRKNKTALSGVVAALGVRRNDSTDEQKINLIRNFSVPNTKEDVFEFMILASSNIDDSVYENNMDSTERSVSNAWAAKTEQVYNKAKLSFGTEPDFVKIQNIYDSKMRAVKKSKGKKIKILIGAVVAYAVLMIFITIMAGIDKKKEAQLEEQLNAVVVEIQTDISNGDYDAALIKANGLRFDASLDRLKAEQWDEQREYLIDLINEKKGGK